LLKSTCNLVAVVKTASQDKAAWPLVLPEKNVKIRLISAGGI
jgi:hypothetical protein